MKLRLTLVLILTLIAVAAMAAGPAKPADKIHELDPLAGKWQCKGMAMAMGDMPKHDIVATVDGKWIFGGKWLEMHYVESKTAANPHPIEVRAFFTWDAGEKKFALGSIVNDGSYSVETSNGWEGDHITFVGPNHMGGPAVNGRDTWTKKGNTVTYVFEWDDKGTWKKVVETTCTRG